jgi:putative colanic acid biosynthesis UDP-glucose lipid carrier transferase
MPLRTPNESITGPSRHQPRLTPARARAAIQLADVAVIVGAALLAHTLTPQLGSAAALAFAIACAVLVALDLFAAAGIYRPRLLGSPAAQIWRVAGAWTSVQALLAMLALVAGGGAALPWRLLAVWWGVALTVLVALHGLAGWLIGRGQRAGWLATQLVLVGAGPQAASFIVRVRQQDPGIVIAGLFDDRRSRVPAMVEGCPVLGTLDDLVEHIRTRHVDQIVITLPQHAASRRLACFEKLRHLPVDVRLTPDLPGLELGGHGMTQIAGVPLLRVFDRPLAGWSRVAKSVEDRVIAALVLLLTAPVLAVVALLVRMSSPGPVLFRQRRYGFDNTAIEVLKFRTMYAQDAQEAETAARRSDPRVTPIGRFLRRTSLDELPQFFNVLVGHMSIVGPRPHAVAHNQRFASLIDGYLSRHRVKPGITGWAQIHGLRGEAETLARMQERVRYDLHYIENWSLLLDLRIIFRTLLVGFSHPNAY